MFRFNNPDALLVLLLIGSVAATVRALESTRLRAEGRTGHPVRWLALAGALVGFGFLTKMLQAFLVLPALALVYLVAAHTPVGRRIVHLLVAFGVDGPGRRLVDRDRRAVAGVVAALHRRLAEQLDPRADPRLQRLRPAHRRRDRLGRRRRRRWRQWGETGMLRLFNSEIGGQIAWLLPGRADPARRRPVVHPPRPAHRPGPRRAARLGRLAAGHRR